MVLSVLYIALQRVLQLVFLLFRSTEFKKLEIVVRRHELAVLRRQVRRPNISVGRPKVLGSRGQDPSRADAIVTLLVTLASNL